MISKERVTGEVTIEYKSNRVNKLNDYSINSKLGNITKGNLLELPVKAILQDANYSIIKHEITSSGLDVEALMNDETAIVECLNWYGGYIHPLRFYSLTRNLAKPSKYKFLICAGVYPTREQCRILKAMNVNIIHYPKQILTVDNDVINYLRNQLLGVITSSIVSFVTVSIVWYISVIRVCTDKVRSLYGSTLGHRGKILSRLKAIGSGLYGRIRKLKYLSKGDSKKHRKTSKLQIKMITSKLSEGKYSMTHFFTEKMYRQKLLNWLMLIYEMIGVDIK